MKKIITFLLCFTLLLSSISFNLYSEPTNIAHAMTQQELENKIDYIDNQIELQKQKLAELEKQKESQLEYLSTLEAQIETMEEKALAIEEQISVINTEIDSFNEQIKQLNHDMKIISEKITEKNTEIENINIKLEESKEEISAILRYSYMTGPQSTIKILMGSKNLANFLTKLEMMKRITEKSEKVISDFKEQVDDLKMAQEELEFQKAQLVDNKKTLKELKKEAVEKREKITEKQQEYTTTLNDLESKYSKIENYIAELDRNSNTYKNYIQNLQYQKNAADDEITNIINSNQIVSSKPYDSSTKWAWPLGNASCYISSHYGTRDPSISGWSFHGGTDITGGSIFGKPIYATREGRVIAAVWGITGYGRYVIIDHEDGFVSVYAHCATLTVSEGDRVEKGQQIANVGSTGNSTGPHLHFEIRRNGAKQDPMIYVKKP